MADVWQYFAKKYQLPYSKDRPLWPERRTLWPTSATFMRNWWIGKWFKHSKTVEYIFEKNWIDSERFQTTACPLKNTEQPQFHSVTVFIAKNIRSPSWLCQDTVLHRYERSCEVTWMSDGPKMGTYRSRNLKCDWHK